MKRLLFAAVAALALGGSVAHASDFSCHMTDQRGNVLDYTFRTASEGVVHEIAFMRNNLTTTYNHVPLWNLASAAGTFTLTSGDNPDWSISYNNPYAALYHRAPATGKVYEAASGQCSDVPIVALAPAYRPPPSSPAYEPQSPAPSSNDVVPFIANRAGDWVNVVIAGHGFTMLVDTGANVSSIPTWLADQLIAEGHARELDGTSVTVADGSSHMERTISVDSLTLGIHTRTNVLMTVSDADPLLGLPVLNAIGRFSIDSQHRLLMFG